MNPIVSYFENQVKEEAVITRKFLDIIPEVKYNWKPHPKNYTLIALATHLVELPSWIPLGIETSELDFAAGDYKQRMMENNDSLHGLFEENQKKAIQSLSETNDAFLKNTWTMRNGEEIYMTITKEDVIRMAMSQTIHHRAQLGVYLRLLEVPVPGSYGPSADEVNF